MASAGTSSDGSLCQSEAFAGQVFEAVEFLSDARDAEGIDGSFEAYAHLAGACGWYGFRPQWALPRSIRCWPPLHGKLAQIEANLVTHSRDVISQAAEVAAPRQMFASIPEGTGRLWLACSSG